MKIVSIQLPNPNMFYGDVKWMKQAELIFSHNISDNQLTILLNIGFLLIELHINLIFSLYLRSQETCRNASNERSSVPYSHPPIY